MKLKDIAPDCRGAVAVYAASSTNIDQLYVAAARELGAVIAKAGYALVDGGGAVGLMGAVNDGCLEAGGAVIGVIPRFMHERGWGHKSLTHYIVADDMHQRKSIMAALADGVIALPGGVGTFEEILEIITWRKLGLYAGPAVFANVGRYYDNMVAMLEHAADEGFMSTSPELYAVAETVVDAFNLAIDK